MTWGTQPDFVCPRCGITGAEMREEAKRKEHIAALLQERSGARDKAHVAQIDEQLARYGYEAAA